MYSRLVPSLATALLLLLLVSIASPIVEIVKAEAVGYLAIKDYLGRTWSIEDVEKIINTTIQTVDGELKSLADYFWIVVDDDPENNKYNLRDFIRSPLDNTTAVLPLTPGDHYIDIYWFGFHQRQLVNIVENTTYVLNLETAPVMPYPYSGEPPSSSYEWDLASNPDGLTIQRRDGNAYVRFVYNQTYIEVAWYDDDTGWNYYPLDIDINTNYDWRFHITDPANPTYTEEHTGSFLWFTWDVAKVAETIKYNRTGEILHLVYTVVVAENQALFNAVDEFWSAAARTIVELAIGMQYIDPVTSTIHRLEDFITFVQSAYNTYMGELYASKYQKTIVLIWDIFCTPTQVVILAHCYDVDDSGNMNPRPITSQNAFTLNNRLVFDKVLHGGIAYSIVDNSEYAVSYTFDSETNKYIYIYQFNRILFDNTEKKIYYPGGDYFQYHVDDLSKYHVNIWFAFKHMGWNTGDTYGKSDHGAYLQIKLNVVLVFDDTADADLFEQRLNTNGISYTRDGNSFTIPLASWGEAFVPGSYTELFLKSGDYETIRQLIPLNSPGIIKISVTGRVRLFGIDWYGQTQTFGYKVKNIRILYEVKPVLIPPQISLLKDGYQTVSGAFAVQIFTDLFRSDNESYILGYYILGNEPPPSYIIRDVNYDMDNDVIHYVYTIISVDCYGQDIVSMDSNTTLDANNETMHHYYLSIKPTVRLFNDVTFALFNLNRMSFLNLAPEIIKYLLAIPPNEGGWGTPIIDWATVSAITLNFSRPYELYYYNKENDEWIRVKPVYYNDTKIYDIVRYSDNVLIEKLEPGDMSQYYYKLIYTDDNSTYKGWLWNDNGTLKMITGQVTWSLTPQELQQLLAMVQLEGIMDQWAQAWEDIARKLGLISESLAAAANWFNANWIYLLLGFFGILFMIVLVFALASRPRITVAAPRTR